ncbi:LOW QUALITY PROTEIN: E3 ubiquitin-protein ligase RNF180, partial [Megalops cyprinoides]|uniref:LOW QUALITY PROTEIN: E3 ubiquitin-protein ligase RNF180 n=1 Tax=Megalops cyprinoides TaxID=118141 RepID=UPI001864CB5A
RKLSCQYCGARLGGFHFVSSAKCIGQDETVHLCASTADHEPQAPFLHCDELGRMAEALCLEVGSKRADAKAAGADGQSSVSSWPPMVAGGGAAHRKARSLDYRDRDGRGSETQQGLSGSCSELLQTRVPDRVAQQKEAPPGTRPCADCQRAAAHFSPRVDSGPAPPALSHASPDPPTQRPSPPLRCGADAPRGLHGEQGVGPALVLRRRLMSQSSTEQGEEEEEEQEEDEEQRGSALQTTPLLATPSVTPLVERRLSKRERNRLKSLRRKQRRRERWIQSQLQEHRQSSTGNPSSSSEDEDVHAGDRDGFICAVCLDVYFSPYMCHPCNHVFCEPCLRTLAKNSPTNTPCPLCRTVITHVFFQKELNQTTRTFFPKEYLSRKQNFQKATCAKWPLPSCRKLFRIFGGFRRQASPITRRQFPHGGYRLDALDFEDDSRGWRFDMDMVIIYIYSVNWVIGFIVFCFLCYFFFPSF